MFKRKEHTNNRPPEENTTAPVFTRAVTVGDSEADCRGRIHPGALLRLLQDAGSEHAEALHIGHELTESKGALWVIVRTAMEIDRLPRAGERCAVLTWPGQTRRVFMPRSFEMQDTAGAVLLRARSEYLLISAETRHMLNPDTLGVHIAAVERPGELPDPARRLPFPPDLPETELRVPRSSELDVNGHLNNSHYVDWAEDLLPLDYLRTHALHSLWVEYRAEVLPYTEVTLRYAQDGDTLYLSGQSEKGVHFTLRAVYGAD